jgi:hypothetical protein
VNKEEIDSKLESLVDEFKLNWGSQAVFDPDGFKQLVSILHAAMALGYINGMAHASYCIGVMLEKRKEFVAACRFYYRARELFEDSRSVAANEAMRECLDDAMKAGMISLARGSSREEFRKMYAKDTLDGLIKEYLAVERRVTMLECVNIIMHRLLIRISRLLRTCIPSR